MQCKLVAGAWPVEHHQGLKGVAPRPQCWPERKWEDICVYLPASVSQALPQDAARVHSLASAQHLLLNVKMQTVLTGRLQLWGCRHPICMCSVSLASRHSSARKRRHSLSAQQAEYLPLLATYGPRDHPAWPFSTNVGQSSWGLLLPGDWGCGHIGTCPAHAPPASQHR